MSVASIEPAELLSVEAVASFAALAHETRLSLFRRLVRKGRTGESAGDVARALDLPPQTASFHLKELRRAGLLRTRRDGRNVFYSVDFDHLCRLRDHLSAYCCVDEVPTAMRPGSGQ